MESAFIVDALRTPIGKIGGRLSSVRPDDLLATTIRALIDRNPGIDLNMVEDVIAGAANQAGEDNRNVARMALLLAGLPVTVAGVTVNRLCASGLQAIMDSTRSIMCGEGAVYIACGVESMTRAPFVLAKNETAWGRKAEIFDTSLGWRFLNAELARMYHPYSMGETAENVASTYKISRSDQDEFALSSQQKYFSALNRGAWNEEIITVEKGNTTDADFNVDEHPRQTTIEKLSSLKAAFKKDGSVTAGNSSGLNDGAAAMWVASETTCAQLSLAPMARVVSMSVAGVDPSIMGMGPVPATQKALQRAHLKISDIGLVELNEAFAAQSLACIRELELDTNKVNVNGGAIALGHPLGCSGVRISTTLLHEMKRRKVRYGLATMCVGVGQGAAIIYENLNR